MHTQKKNDLVQRQRQGDILTQTLRYKMGTPGISDPGYVPDIHIRPQYWTGNIRAGSLDINHGLMGLGPGRKAVRGGTEMSADIMDAQMHPLRSEKVTNINVRETRIDAPAWNTRGTKETVPRELSYSFRPFVTRPAVPLEAMHTRSAFLSK